jgi:uncharacterized damage-inducible protein DinB
LVNNLKERFMPRRAAPESNLREVLLETYAANDRMNQILFEHLDAQAWRANPPGLKTQPGRSIAAIFAHMHNNRLVWLKRSAPHLRCPRPLDPLGSTLKQTAVAHRSSAACCLKMLGEALSENPDRRVRKFSRGSWAPVWPAGATMFAYMFAHEAHHRGQVIALAHQLGYRLPDRAAYGIWHWEKLWRDLGFACGPR